MNGCNGDDDVDRGGGVNGGGKDSSRTQMSDER